MNDKKSIIMMVDDNLTILSAGKNALRDKYTVVTMQSGLKLFTILEKITPDLILLDVEMPDMDGYEVIKRLKSNEQTKDLPVIFLTALTDTGSELEGLSLGAIDYLSKPFSPPLLLKRIENHLLMVQQRKELKHYNDNLQEMVVQKTRTVYELQNAVLKTVAELVECRDDITGGHIERTQKFICILFDHMIEKGIYKEISGSISSEFLIQSSQLHDVGKIAIKDNILMKPGKLTYDEFEVMKTHTTFGASVIERIQENTTEHTFLNHAKIFAESHHEKWDGSGYPKGLSGEEIPLQGRLMAIADVYDALVSSRPYKEAMPHEQAVEIIKSQKGIHFDPLLVDVFLDVQDEFYKFLLQTASEGLTP